MPELPEVETIKRRLATVLPGKKIKSLKVFAEKSFVGSASLVEGATITKVTRRAKILSIWLDNEHALVIHLKMTGQLLYVDDQQRLGGGHPSKDWSDQLPGKHTRVSFEFSDASHLYFNDMRMFGWIKVVNMEQHQQLHAQLGPDINDEKVTAKYLHEQFQRRSIPIKQAMMMNSIVCGVGNIYVCDTLHLAKISPFRPAKSLSLDEVATVFDSAVEIIERAIELQGTTFDGMYVNSDGLSGNYQDVVRVYGREGDVCEICSDEILRQKIAQRSTFYCPTCQPLLA